MDIFDLLSLVGGLSLFLFGMSLMGEALEKRAGGGLKQILGRITGNKLTGFLLGLGITAVIQSSSATTVMVVGFVNSGLMNLRQAINVIMGANVGTTVTSWILSLTGIDSDNIFIQLLKPSSFTPILALIGIIFYMSGGNGKKKDTGLILLGFATLMFGMDAMTDAVSGLANVPEFTELLLMFSNPVVGVIAGALLTAVLQSSSASVGMLQALSATGQVTYGTAIPIIMGQNIGTCVTAIISSAGANKNAKRAAAVHLMFNIFGTVVLLTVFCILNAIFDFTFVDTPVNQLGTAVVHTTFNLACTILMFPLSGVLEKAACFIIKDDKGPENIEVLDERLFATPSVAVARCAGVTEIMAELSTECLKNSMLVFQSYNEVLADRVREDEKRVDVYEDTIGTYLVKLSACPVSEKDSHEAAKILHVISDFERISDHAVNIVDSAEEMRKKKADFSKEAWKEIEVITEAVNEILTLSLRAYCSNNIEAAKLVDPLNQVINKLKEQIRMSHIMRLQTNECTVELGFIHSDLMTDLGRVADHCSNIAECVIEMSHTSLDLHEYLRDVQTDDPEYRARYVEFSGKYAI